MIVGVLAKSARLLGYNTSSKLALFLSSTPAMSQRRCRSTGTSERPPRVLITGGLGQLGIPFAKHLRSKFGADNVILTDIKKAVGKHSLEPFYFLDIMDTSQLRKLIVDERIDWLVHFSALLSAIGEQNLPLAMKINIEGVHNILTLAQEFNLRTFIPSTIGAFGPNSPKEFTPDDCIQQPTTIYGVSKVHVELLGSYLQHRYGLDFRSLRLPGVISADVEPGGGTTDYAIHIFKNALKGEPYKCFLHGKTRLPMIWIDDVIRGMFEFMNTPKSSLKRCVYNLAGVSFTPEELHSAIMKGMKRHHLEKEAKLFDVVYESDFRQSIADSWPQALDDSNARKDWKWTHQVDVDGIVDKMFSYLKTH